MNALLSLRYIAARSLRGAVMFGTPFPPFHHTTITSGTYTNNTGGALNLGRALLLVLHRPLSSFSSSYAPSSSSSFLFHPCRVLRQQQQRHTVGKKKKLVTFHPWKRRPGGLALHSRPQMVQPHYFRHGYRSHNPDDPTRLLKPSHVILKRCPECRRTRFVLLHERDHFHYCCENRVLMKEVSNMKKVMNREHRLTQMLRQWDVEGERPWDNPHRPKPKGRSKLKKK